MQAENTGPRAADATDARRRRGSVALLALALAGATMPGLTGCALRGAGELAARAEPSPAVAAALASDRDAGSHAVDVLDFDWFDDSRGRLVPARLYQPRNAAAAPLVVFSHGLGGSRYGYSHLGRYWAAHGIAALHVQHAGSDRALWSAPALSLFSTLRAAATEENAIARVGDVSFALDRVLADPKLAHAVDARKIAVAGHSFGANTALLAAGATFRDGARVLAFRDARVRAAIVLSAPSLPQGLDAGEVYAPIRVPTLHLTGTADVTQIPGLSTSPEERRIPFDMIPATPRYLGVFEGGRHSAFSDWANDPTAAAIKATTRSLTLAFLREVFEPGSRSEEALAAQARLRADTLAAWESKP
jgi:predicted dienelactone hydrolase